MTIGLLLIVVPVCDGLASGHSHVNQGLDHNKVTHSLDAHMSEPCHALKAAPLAEPSVDSPPNAQAFTGFQAFSRSQPLARIFHQTA